MPDPLKSFRGFRPRHKVFSMAFSSIEKHCSYISYLWVCRFAAGSRWNARRELPSFFWIITSSSYIHSKSLPKAAVPESAHLRDFLCRKVFSVGSRTIGKSCSYIFLSVGGRLAVGSRRSTCRGLSLLLGSCAWHFRSGAFSLGN